MKNSSALIRRLLAIFAMVSLTLLGTAVATNTAEAAPYNNSISITVTFGTNSQGQEVVTVTISHGAANRTYKIVIHSTPQTLGFITTDASGNGAGTFLVPAGFSGSHSIQVIDTVTGATVGSVPVDVPASGGATPISGGSSGGLPNTGAAILGVGVLALAFLAGGGLLLMVGRKRGNAKQAA